MKPSLKKAVPAVLLLSFLSTVPGSAVRLKPGQDKPKVSTADLWKLVEAADRDGLPRTAIEHLKEIVRLSLEEKREGEALRALTRRLVLESVVEGNKPGARVARIREEIDQAPEGMKMMLRTILAQWYRHYFSRNRWRFAQRSATAGGIDEKDFTTWDLRRIVREIDALYQDILKDEASLKRTPVSVYRDFLEPGDPPESLRPTMFDFVAFEALGFYVSGERAAAAPEDAFVLEADSPVLGPADEFILYRPETTDEDSPALRALRLYQSLLEFHRGDRDRDVFLDADLHRLEAMRNLAAGESASARYLERLKEIAEKNPASAFSSLADYLRARELKNQGDLVQAYALADRGRKAHPASLGGRNCDALISDIASRDFDVRNERVVSPGTSSVLDVRYRNLTALHFRAVRDDFEARLAAENAGDLFWPGDEPVRELLEREPAAAWSADLPATADFQARAERVAAPALPPGFYRLLVSADPAFSRGKNKIQAGSFWVSEWGIVTAGAGRALEGFVVRGVTGDPVSGASVSLYDWDYGTDRLVKRGEGRTDDAGAFALAAPESYSNRLLVARGEKGIEVVETQVLTGSGRPASYERERTVFFTDRSLYRPGQTIHFKGLCLKADENRADYRILPRRNVRVVLRDANAQEASVLTLTTNDFGSFSGAFTAPADRLTGAMTISTENPRGSCPIRVEEYKRPKFQVKIDVPDREFRLNDEISVPAEAMSYAGAPVDGALVKYRVIREVRYPVWWWWNTPARGESREIAHGTSRTDAEGKFMVVFKAVPDPKSTPSSQPVFTFTVTADVTDGAGETRSAAGTIRAGFTALEAGLAGSDWQEKGEPVVLTATAATLNGKPAAAEGVVEVYALRGPGRPVPRDLFAESGDRGRVRPSGSAASGDSETMDWRRWPEGRLAGRKEFAVSAVEGSPCRLSWDLPPGAYRAILKTADRYGTAVESRFAFLVLDPAADRFAVPVPFHAAARSGSVEPDGTFELFWGTGYERGPVLIEVHRDGRRLQRYWTRGTATQAVVRVPVTEAFRGGFVVSAAIVKDNRLYREDRRVSVPWTNKRLDLRWKTFRSKLRPGQDETWSLQVRGPKADVQAAEMVASLYDASLDQFYPHGFGGISAFFRNDATYLRSGFTNRAEPLGTFFDRLNPSRSYGEAVYIHFPRMITESLFDFDYGDRVLMAAEAVPAPMAASREAKNEVSGGVIGGVLGGSAGEKEAGKDSGPPPPAIDLFSIQARVNLNETAFFYPHLLTDAEGTVTLEFKMPEALTEWRFLGFAHTTGLRSGSIEAAAVTQKELMVQPNPPRFLREGDVLEFTVKVTNMTEKEAAGAVELRFFDPRNDAPLDGALANANPKLSMAIPAKQSRTFSWPITVPDGAETVGFRAVAAAAGFSDGEEGMVPVLSRSLMVRESIPLWISGRGEKRFRFDKLAQSAGSTTLRSLGLTVQMSSNPAWYAVQALPYLMEYPYECSEQVFNRLYANALARKIAGSDPRIRRVFELWKGTPALQSNLEKNQELKSVLLEESPWVVEAKNESQAKRNIGLLFDENTTAPALKRAVQKLVDMQLPDGSWPWFPGGPGNDYITLYIVTGFGRLEHLGVPGIAREAVLRAVGRLDSWIREVHERILADKTEKLNNLSPSIALYLYARSFFLDGCPIPDASRKALDYFLGQGAAFWLQLDSRQSQAHLALGLNRFGDAETARKITRSLKERSKVDEELGRYWAEGEASWWWRRAPIETQAMMIEAFDEVAGDAAAVEECRIWLLKQKQTQDWKTTKATADAVYGLILRGADLLASDEIVEVILGGRKVEPEKVEAGTGFYEKRFPAAEIRPEMGEIEVCKTDPGIAWGGVHWQYLEDISKITPHERNPLRLKKSLFKKTFTKKGPEIEPVRGPLAVGDTLVVRLELRTDRDMEYVHLRDHRGSGLEPVNVLSTYRFRDGLAYYEATKDAAAHFFIDDLPKGAYVFEYELRVQLRGRYQNGMAHIECMYAPEFNSHSESRVLEVR